MYWNIRWLMAVLLLWQGKAMNCKVLLDKRQAVRQSQGSVPGNHQGNL